MPLTNTLEIHLQKFDKLLDGLAQLIEAVAHPSVSSIPSGEGWRNSGQVLLIKAYHHLRSVRTLARGVRVGEVVGSDNPDLYLDHSSMAALGRAALEAYATYNYIFCEGTREEQLFRFRVWKLQGLKSRLDLKGFAVIDHRIEAVRRSDQVSVAVLRKQIECDPMFQSLDKGQRSQALNGRNWRLGRSLPGIAADAGLPKHYALDMYNHFSEYAHSGAVSSFQIQNALWDGSGPQLAGVTIGFCSVLLARAIATYVDQFEVALDALDANKTLMKELLDWLAYIDLLYSRYGEVTPTDLQLEPLPSDE